MFKRKTIYSAVVASALLSVSAVSLAAETATGTASVTVQNAFDFDQITAINFGTLRATQDRDVDGNSTPTTIAYSEVAKYRIVTDGSSNVLTGYTGGSGDVKSSMTEIVAGTPAEFAVTNAAPFSTLTVTTADPTTALDSDLNGDTSIVSTFTLTTPSDSNSVFHAYIDDTDVRISGGANDGDTLNQSSPQTDATGAVNLIVGANLYMKKDVDSISDGVYTGNYTIAIDY